MTKHTQSILLFGIILPAVGMGLVFGGLLKGRGKLLAKKEQKIQMYEGYKASAEELAAVESQLSVEGRMDQMEYWDSQLKKEFVQNLTQSINEITSQFSEDQLMRTELSRPSARSPLASSTDNPHSRFKLSFEGGFSPMQTALAELEMRMPQLVLESLEIKPYRDSGGTGRDRLRFDVTYLAWHNLAEAGGR